MTEHITLHQNVYSSGVLTHTDILNPRPVVLSTQRANKPGKMAQGEMQDSDIDPNNREKCLLCNTDRLLGKPTIRILLDGKVGYFINAAPFLPHDQQMIFIRHDDEIVTKTKLHIYQMQQIRKFDLYYLLAGAVELGRRHSKKVLHSTDLLRMIVGFNIGPDAGQSVPHIHAQYGWEVMLDKMDLPQKAIDLHFEELENESLVIYPKKEHLDEDHLKNSEFKLTVPWTPHGQYAVDLFFTDKFEIHKLDEADIKIFACLGHRLLQRYDELGICNVNIIFESSPLHCQIRPVTVRFIPVVNKLALYERFGRDVVDTPPGKIVGAMTNIISDWKSELGEICLYDPSGEYDMVTEH